MRNQLSPPVWLSTRRDCQTRFCFIRDCCGRQRRPTVRRCARRRPTANRLMCLVRRSRSYISSASTVTEAVSAPPARTRRAVISFFSLFPHGRLSPASPVVSVPVAPPCLCCCCCFSLSPAVSLSSPACCSAHPSLSLLTAGCRLPCQLHRPVCTPLSCTPIVTPGTCCRYCCCCFCFPSP